MKKHKQNMHVVGITLLTILTSIIMLIPPTLAKASEIEDALLLYSPVFSIDYYSEHYPEINKMYSSNSALMLYYFINEGMAKGQQGIEDFNVYAYQSRYPDLQDAYHEDLVQYYIHYILIGKNEGLSGVPTDDLNYESISGSISPEDSKEDYIHDIEKVNQLINDILVITNNIRIQNDTCPLTTTPELQRTAAIRAKECSEYFSHYRPNGKTCFTAYKENGVSYRYAAENIACGNASASQIVEAWMNSPGHKANILNSKYKHIGIGIYQNDGYYKLYWAQNFTS